MSVLTKEEKQQIAGSYAFILCWIRLASALVLLITVFIPAIKVGIGSFAASVNGFGIIADWLESSANLSANMIDKVMVGSAGLMFLCSIFYLIFAFRNFFAKNKGTVIVRNDCIESLIINAIYFLLCLLAILIELDWDFGSVLTGKSMVSTSTYIPVLVQIVFAIAEKLIKKHYVKAIKGQTAPIRIQIGGAQTFSAGHTSGAESSPAMSQADSIELLTKYKTLLDQQIITQEEFEEKKKELLNGTGSASSADTKKSPGNAGGGEGYRVFLVKVGNTRDRLKMVNILTEKTMLVDLSEMTQAIDELPSLIAENISYEEAKELQATLETVNAEVEITKME